MDQNLIKLSTEQPNPNTTDIDLYSTDKVLQAISDEDVTVAYAVRKELKDITALTEEYIQTIETEHRVFYVGCGTSGRLAYIDAAELIPTYCIAEDVVIPIMAGGLPAMRKAKEHAEDIAENGSKDVKEQGFTKNDFLIGIAASGRTPYVVDAINYAKSLGAKTGCIVCNKNTQMGALVDYPIEIEVGPEVVRGSTRMKSATAQKLTLNMISTTVFVRLGGSYKNLLMNGKATTYKAEQRHIRALISETGISEEKAIALLEECDGDPKPALFMAFTNASKDEADKVIKAHHNRLREAINEYKQTVTE